MSAPGCAQTGCCSSTGGRAPGRPSGPDGLGSRVTASPGAHVNVVMLGALAAALGEPSLDDLRAAAVELFGKKAGRRRASATAIEAGYASRRERPLGG